MTTIFPILGIPRPGFTPQETRTLTVNATRDGVQTPEYKEAVIFSSFYDLTPILYFPLKDGARSSQTVVASALEGKYGLRLFDFTEEPLSVFKEVNITSDLELILDLSEDGSGGILDYPLLTGIGELSGYFDLDSLPEDVTYSDITIRAYYIDPLGGRFNGLQAAQVNCQPSGLWLIEGISGHHMYNVVISIPGYNDIIYSNKVTSDDQYVPPGDPYWDMVVALLHFNGDLTDETGRDWEMFSINQGSVTFSAVNPLFGSESLWIDNPNGNNVHAPYTSNLFTTGDVVTIECFVKVGGDVLGKSQMIFGQFFNIGAGDQSFFLSDRKLTYQRGPNVPGGEGEILAIGTNSIPLDQWVHIAFVYDGLSITAYMDGVEEVSHTTSTGWVSTPTTAFTIGDSNIGSYNGQYRSASKIKIDEFRITRGVARYTENFNPPTGPFLNHGLL